jgi:hypothetical protein
MKQNRRFTVELLSREFANEEDLKVQFIHDLAI